jgi:hypothetical protein
MSPSPKDKNLDALLVDALVPRGGGPSIKHKLMQLSLFAYLNDTKNLEDVEMEYELRFICQKKCKKTSRYSNNKKKEKYYAGWSVDLALVYLENNKRVCELVEVESINAAKFWDRLKNIYRKSKTINRIAENKFLNDIIKEADEIRVSIALDSRGLEGDDLACVIDEFKSVYGPIAKKLAYSGTINAHNLYLLRDDLYAYLPKSLNPLMLDGLIKGPGINDERRNKMKSAIIAAYNNIKSLYPDKLRRLYNTVSLA